MKQKIDKTKKPSEDGYNTPMGDYLKRLRLAQGLTLDELSQSLKRAGLVINPTTLSHYESGRHTPPERYKYLAQVLSTSTPNYHEILYTLSKLGGVLEDIKGVTILDLIQRVSEAELDYLLSVAEGLVNLQNRK